MNGWARTKMSSTFFPEFITKLPQADINIDGIQSWLFQGENQQVLFMEFSKSIDVPDHSHKAQWGVVLDGTIELTIKGKTKSLNKGDTYALKAGEIHSAKIQAGYKDLTFFNQKDRYTILC